MRNRYLEIAKIFPDGLSVVGAQRAVPSKPTIVMKAWVLRPLKWRLKRALRCTELR